MMTSGQVDPKSDRVDGYCKNKIGLYSIFSVYNPTYYVIARILPLKWSLLIIGR